MCSFVEIKTAETETLSPLDASYGSVQRASTTSKLHATFSVKLWRHEHTSN